jgi:hypothetical protein
MIALTGQKMKPANVWCRRETYTDDNETRVPTEPCSAANSNAKCRQQSVLAQSVSFIGVLMIALTGQKMKPANVWCRHETYTMTTKLGCRLIAFTGQKNETCKRLVPP